MQKFLEGSTRQLTDLRVGPSKDDPRPFFDHGELKPTYQDYMKPAPFRVLRWHPVTGEEVCATSEAEVQHYEAEGYVAYPIASAPTSRVESVRDELETLSPEDRALVIEAQRQARLAALQSKLAGLSDHELAAVLGDAPVAKRGPGRPRKVN